MKVVLKICFHVKKELISKVVDVFKSINILIPIPSFKDYETEVFFKFGIELNEKIDYESLKKIYKYLENNLEIDGVGEAYSFRFSDEEFESSPFFILNSPGNSGAAFLDDKGTVFDEEIFCNACGIIQRRQKSPLVIDTSKIKNRFLVNVGAYWVVSEKMARLMEDWKLSGFELKPVIHKGPEKGKQPTYQIVPFSTMPNWSKEMKHYYFITEEHERCNICGVKGRIEGPYHYDKKDLINMNKDVYLAEELINYGKYVYRRTLFSKKFRDLVIEYKISKDVRDLERFGPRDWAFEPIILV